MSTIRKLIFTALLWLPLAAMAAQLTSTDCSEFAPVTYDGVNEPAVTCTDMTEGTDFSVEYSGNANVGTGTATIQGLDGDGAPDGAPIEKTFTINPANISNIATAFSVKATFDAAYTGNAKKPGTSDIEATAKVGDYAVASTDWEVDPDGYGTNKVAYPINSGTFKIKAKATGSNYIGTTGSITFNIKFGDLASINFNQISKTYTGEAITLNGADLTATGYAFLATDLTVACAATCVEEGEYDITVSEGASGNISGAIRTLANGLKIEADAPAITYAITKIPATNGSFTVSVGGSEAASAAAGATVNLVATPAAGYQVRNWSVTGGVTLANPTSATTSFTMPANAVTVTVSFEEITYAITKVFDPPALSDRAYFMVEVRGFQAGNAKDGDEVTLTTNYSLITYCEPITEFSCRDVSYAFKSWDVKAGGTDVEVKKDGDNPLKATFEMPAAAVTVTAKWEKVYIISFLYQEPEVFSIQVDDGESVKSSTAFQTIVLKGGETISLSILKERYTGRYSYNNEIIENQEFLFDSWQLGLITYLDGGQNTDKNVKFIMPESNISLYARYNAVYTVTFADCTPGCGTQPDNLVDQYNFVEINAPAASAGYRFKEWKSNDIDFYSPTTNSRLSFFPRKNVMLEAVYEPVYNLTLDCSEVDGYDPNLCKNPGYAPNTSAEGEYGKGDIASLITNSSLYNSQDNEWTIFKKWECSSDGTGSFSIESSASATTRLTANSFNPGETVTCKPEYEELTDGFGMISVNIIGESYFFEGVGPSVIRHVIKYGYYEGPIQAEIGTDVILTAKPYPGYKFLKWRNGDDILGTDPSLTFSVEDMQHTIAAEFVPIKYPFSITANPAAGAEKIEIPDYGSYYDEENDEYVHVAKELNSGEKVDMDFGNGFYFEVTLATGYEFTGWEVTKGGDLNLLQERTVLGTSLTKMPAEEVALTAKFKIQEYRISLYNYAGCGGVTGGSYNISGDLIKSFHYKDAVTLTASNSEECPFTKWEGLEYYDYKLGEMVPITLTEGTATSPIIKFLMPPDNISIEAKFTPPPPGDYWISIASVTGGSISGRTSANEGDNVTFTATANSCYAFEKWTVKDYWDNTPIPGVSTTTNPVTFTMPATDIEVYATFTAIPNCGGSGNNNPGGGVTPPSSTYSIVVTSGAGGTARADKSAASYQTRVTLSATPDEGYRFKRWISSTSIPNSFMATTSFEMPARAVSIQAEFELDNSYAVAVTSGTGGTATASASTATYLAKVTLTATPSDGYRFKEWVVKSGDVVIASAKSANTEFAMPPRAVAIEATFEEGSSPIIARLTTSAGPVMAHAINGGILLQNLPQNAKVEVYSLQGKIVHSANTGNSQTLKIQARSGMYIVKINGNALRVAVK